MTDNISLKRVLDFTLKWEGYMSNYKDDPGKLTIWGISSKYNPMEVAAMKDLIDAGRKDEAFGIAVECYRTKYWLRAGCDKLEFKLACVAFEFAVIPGIGALNKVSHLAKGDWKDLLLRRIAYFSDKNNKKNIRGWIRRCVALYRWLE